MAVVFFLCVGADALSEFLERQGKDFIFSLSKFLERESELAS